MAVQSIQSMNTETKHRCNLGGALLCGILAGNAVHDYFPLRKGTLPQALLRDVVSDSYSQAYMNMSRNLQGSAVSQPVQDAFIKMVGSGDVNSSYKGAMETIEKDFPQLAEEFKNIDWLASQEGRTIAHSRMRSFISANKHSRPLMPFLFIGALVFTFGAFMYNVLNKPNNVA